MKATPFAFGTDEIEALTRLRTLAAAQPVDMLRLIGPDKKIRSNLKAAHTAQMNKQTIIIPFGFMVTFSIETGHPAGSCRHMSMSSPAKDRLPAPHAVDIVAEHLGFVGGYQACVVWLEDLSRGDGTEKAVNLVQPLTVTREGRA